MLQSKCFPIRICSTLCHPRLCAPCQQCWANRGLWENDRELQLFGCLWDCSSFMFFLEAIILCSLAAHPVLKEKLINHFSGSQVVLISCSLQSSVNTHPLPHKHSADTHSPAFSPCFLSCCGTRQQVCVPGEMMFLPWTTWESYLCNRIIWRGHSKLT